jgi:SNF2 family DNA or RNA helicase
MLTQPYKILTEELADEIVALPETEQSDWLFVYPHEEIRRAWHVEGFDDEFFYDFEDTIGRYCTVVPSNLDAFLDEARDLNYNVAFLEDPAPTMEWYHSLRDRRPPVELNSDFPETINGFMPFQLEGFNYLVNGNPRGGHAIWSTGTGKTALMAGLIRYYIEQEGFDLALVVVKRNNKYDMHKKLDQLGSIGSHIIDGPMRYRNTEGNWVPAKRAKVYELMNLHLRAGIPVVAVCNYEKFRDDDIKLQAMLKDRKVLILWDEMPTKLSNRSTKLYEAVQKALYRKFTYKEQIPRPSALVQFEFTATPIENVPEDQYNCTRLIDPQLWPTVTSWEQDHVAGYNRFSHKPDRFKNLDLMRLKLDHMTHFVDKSIPEIAKYFPDVVEDPQYIDWHPSDWRVYQKAEDIVIQKYEEEGRKANAFQLMGLLQMICDQPEIVNASAENRLEFEEELLAATDDELGDVVIRGSELALTLVEELGEPLTSKHCQKLVRLHDLLTKHKDEKVLVFSTWGPLGMPLIEKALDAWGITYRSYRGTEAQREKAKWEWRESDDLQVLLLSDAGSDSIDLPEASVVIHYNLPMKWSKLNQRQNRAHRINSTHASVTFYMLIMAGSIEERIIEIITKKLGYHFSLFKEGAMELLEAAGMSNDDLWYLLTGQQTDIIE